MPESQRAAPVWLLIITLSFSGLIGCNSRPNFHVSSVHVIQTAWDSVQVTVFFEESDMFGNRTPIVPEESWITIYNASYDTLYVGSDTWLPIPDVDLGDRESLLWGIFTRFDPARDVVFTTTELRDAWPVYRGCLGIDATFKTGYPDPLVMNPAVVQLVDRRWEHYWHA